MTSAAAFFDLDKTIIAKSSTLAFGRSFLANGLINRRAALATAYAQLVYVLAGADDGQMNRIRDRTVRMVAGWDVVRVRDIVAETLHEIVNPLIYAEALELIAAHRLAGDTVVIVSTSGADIVEPIGRMLGVDEVIATRMVTDQGRYTGEIEFYAYGANKATAVTQLAAERGWDLAACHAYSDSATDLPLLELVGHPTAVNPDRSLRRAAAERGWPIRSFTRPVPLRRRLHRSPLAAACAAGFVTMAAGCAWYALRNSRKRRQHPAG